MRYEAGREQSKEREPICFADLFVVKKWRRGTLRSKMMGFWWVMNRTKMEQIDNLFRNPVDDDQLCLSGDNFGYLN
jgi:hypothetical protein